MEGICPRCQLRQDFPGSGNYQCAGCKARFEVALGSPRPPAPAMAVPPPRFTSPFSQGGASTGLPFTDQPAPSPAPPPQTDWGTATPDAALGAPCAGHPSNPAAQVCERCGDFMCRLCTTMVEGRAYCPKCFDLLYSRGALSFSQRQFTLPGLTLTLGIVAFLTSGCVVLGMPIGIAGVIAGLRALKEHRARPDLPKRGMTLWGLSISAISILISVVGAVLMLLAIIKSS